MIKVATFSEGTFMLLNFSMFVVETCIKREAPTALPKKITAHECNDPRQVIEETQNISEMRLFSSCTRIFRWSWSGPKNCLAQRMNLASGSWNSSFFGGFMAASDDVFDQTKRSSEMRPIWGLPSFILGIMVQ